MVLMGAVFFLIGTFFLSGYGDKESCTEPVTATVVRMERRISHTTTGKRHRRTTTTNYAPVFKYEYNGREYTYTSSVATHPPQFKEGEQVTIRVNPANPNEIYYEPSGGTVFMTVVFRIVGVLVALAGIAALITGLVKKPKETIA